MDSATEPLLLPALSHEGSGKDRRRFIIVSVFDATLVILVWILHVVSEGRRGEEEKMQVTSSDDWLTALKNEVNIGDPHFFEKSLFDVVIVALLRMVPLPPRIESCSSSLFWLTPCVD